MIRDDLEANRSYALHHLVETLRVNSQSYIDILCHPWQTVQEHSLTAYDHVWEFKFSEPCCNSANELFKHR